MPRLTPQQKDERLKAQKAKLSQKAKERGELRMKPTANKIKQILSLNQASYTELLKGSGCSSRAFRRNLNRLVENGEIAKQDGKRGKYFLPQGSIADHEPLEYLGLHILHESLKNGAINEFNHYLGSLITYTFKHYEVNQAMSIISTVLREVQQYLKSESKVESAEWALWRDLNSREFVIQVPTNENNMREAIDYGKFEQKWQVKIKFIVREIAHKP